MKNWYFIEPIDIHFDELWLTQTHLNIEGVLGRKFSTDPFPRVVNFEGDNYLEDGHHRVVIACLNPFIYHRLRMRVFRL